MSHNKHALIIVENSYPPLDVRVWNEATALRDAGWNVTVICPTPKRTCTDKENPKSFGIPQDMDGISFYRFPIIFAENGIRSYFREYIFAFISITRLSWQVWKATSFDIIHLCNPPDIFFPIGLFFRLLGARVVFDHHDLLPEAIASRYHGLLGKLLYIAARVTEYLTFHSANIVISTNESYRRIAIERGNVSKNRIFVVRNGPKKEEFVPVKPDPNLKRGLPYLACYVGVMGYEDGIPELLSSIRYIIQDLGRKDIGFALVGDGSMRATLLSTLKSWGIDSLVDMPGLILDNFILRRYLSTADICLSPEPLNPLNSKSTFIKVGEYMALGKPIIAFNLDETRITAGEAAIYVDSNNIPEFGRAIVNLVDSPEKRQRMGEIGRERFLNYFAWEHQVPNLLQAYKIADADNGTLLPNNDIKS